MPDEPIRILALCVALAGFETLHGVARAALLVPRIGKQRALKVAIVTGSLLAFAVCWWLVPPIGYRNALPLFGVGLTIVLFMASFDIALARMLLHRPWRRVLEDFDPRSGNYLSLGLLLMVTFPYLSVRLREWCGPGSL